MTDAKKTTQSDMPDVVPLTKNVRKDGEAEADAKNAASAEAPRDEQHAPASLTPVFDAVVREWRAEGREIPLRHKPAVPAQARRYAA